MRKQITLMAFLIAGCVSSTGVQSLGQGTYRVESGSEFGLAQAQQRALQEASQYCQSFGSPPQEISSRSGSRVDALGDPIQTYELVFRCGGSGQPHYAEGPAYRVGSPPPPHGQPPPPSGYIQLENRTGRSLRVECGHHGDHGRSYDVPPGHSGGVSVNHVGEIDCRALDHHGIVAGSRRFYFHHGDESFHWMVQDHHH